MTVGQINRGTEFGELLYQIVIQPDIKTIVEIGTWNGCGTTKCIIDGIKDSHENKVFLTFESNREKYNEAINHNKNNITENIKFIFGRLTDVYDLTWLKHITLRPEQQVWLWEDIENYKNCPLVIDQIPEQIDLLLLDGGEFTTVPEFILLKNKYKFLALDDIQELKCHEIYKQLLKRSNHELIYQGQTRSFAIFKKK